MTNVSIASSKTSDELEGKQTTLVTTIAIRNNSYELLRKYSDELSMSKVEFLTNLLSALDVLSDDDIQLLLLIGQAKSVKNELDRKNDTKLHYLLLIDKLILLPLNYYKSLVHQTSSKKEP